MTTIFKLQMEADCVALDGDRCDDEEVNKECFEAGASGGACEWLCLSNILEIKTFK